MNRKNEHHIFLATPAEAGLIGPLARTLSTGRAALAAAGHGAPVPAPVSEAVPGPVSASVLGPQTGGVHLEDSILGGAEAGWTGFFEGAGARAAALAARLSGPVGRLVVPVSGYDTLYPLLWRERAMAGAVAPFAEAAGALALRARGWPEVLREIVAALRPRVLVVLPEPAGLPEICAALVPGAALEFAPLRPRRRPDTGLAMLQRLYGQGVALPPRQINRLLKFHDRLVQPAPLAAFAPLEGARLRRRFRAELARLGAHPQVQIGGAPAPAPMIFAAE